MDKNELAVLLDKHAKWLRDEEGGARAILAGANLAGANLAGANLDGANLARAILAGANLARANLARANLDGAYLARANLDGAILAGANLDGGVVADGQPHRRATRGDGYEFLLWHTDRGWRICAGCRFFTPDDAREHWARTRPTDTPLGADTDDILTMFEAHMRRHDAAKETA